MRQKSIEEEIGRQSSFDTHILVDRNAECNHIFSMQFVDDILFDTYLMNTLDSMTEYLLHVESDIGAETRTNYSQSK